MKRRTKDGLIYFAAAGLLLIVMVFIIIIAAPFSDIKSSMAKNTDAEGTGEVSENDNPSATIGQEETDADEQKGKDGITISNVKFDQARGDAVCDTMTDIFNVGYRSIVADLDSYVANVCDGMESSVVLYNDPETNEKYSFAGEYDYSTEEFAKLFADWVVENEAEIEASFTPEVEIPDPPGPFYYMKGTLNLNVHACNDLTNLADYFLVKDMQLNQEYQIPVEVEVIHDEMEGREVVGSLLREPEFIENWKIISADDGEITPD